MNNLEQLKESGEAPGWMTTEGYETLSRGYLLKEETPLQMYKRVAKAAASYYEDSAKWEAKFFDIMWKNWLCLASPVAANMGTDRGLPISCNTIHIGDSVDSIFHKNYELAILSKNGAGVGIYMGDIRARGAIINGNGASEGVIPWSKVYDITTVSVNQGSTRRGASALYLPIDHGDIDEFINIRRPTGDVNRRCLNVNHGVCVKDEWMQAMLDGDTKKRLLWQEILKSRVETGEPYLFFTDNVNGANPECYKANNLDVKTSNICTEIFLHTDPSHTFVCCLSSLNLVRWNEWKDTDTVQATVRFLDAVLEEYIRKTEDRRGLEASRRSAMKGRAIGIGVLGWHTLLQNNMIPFDSFEAMSLNAQIFRTLRSKAEEESKLLASELGEPEWCKGFGRRNTHLIAIAPTVSNSIISGGYSAGIEPLAANIFSQKSAKGTFIRKNPTLEKLLEEKGQNIPEVWSSINKEAGSIQHLKFLSAEEKEVFLTAREINQHTIIKQAAQRQKWIDQGQSINLFFAANSDPKYIHDVHLAAWKAGLKSLYYLRTDGVIRGDLASRSENECKACEA
jgi:ribonucleoside-diphosphate reductase alpha chain